MKSTFLVLGKILSRWALLQKVVQQKTVKLFRLRQESHAPHPRHIGFGEKPRESFLSLVVSLENAGESDGIVQLQYPLSNFIERRRS